MSYNFVADSIHTKKLVADFLEVKCNFLTEKAFCVFDPPWELRGNVRCSS